MEQNHGHVADEQNQFGQAVANVPAADENLPRQEVAAEPRLLSDTPVIGQQPLRALRTERPSFVTFRNCTDRLVDVYWFDFHGRRVLYKTLAAQGRLSVNTYETHPWIFLDHHTHVNLVANHSKVFFPKHSLQEGGDEANVTPLHRVVDITIPIFTLKDCAIQVLLKSVAKTEDLKLLQLPRTLLNDVLAAATSAYC